jgi:hypothetical protein
VAVWDFVSREFLPPAKNLIQINVQDVRSGSQAVSRVLERPSE